MNTMHICFLTHEYPPLQHGGIGSFVQALGREMVQYGINVSVVGPGGEETEVVENDFGVKVYRLPRPSWKIGRFYQNAKNINKKLWELHSQHPIDAIETSELGMAFVDANLPAQKVIRMHGGHHFFAKTLGKKPAFWRSYQEKKSFRKADHIIAVSRFVGEETRNLLRLGNRKIDVIYNPINVKKFFRADSQKVLKGKLLFVGTVCEKKGVQQLVEAMPEIVRKHPEASLDIVGRDWVDPKTKESYTEWLKNHIPLDVKHCVNFVGAVPHDEIPVYIERAEVCVCPSLMESFGLMWVEMLAMGKPVVGSSVGPANELFIHDVTGFLANPYSPFSIAQNVNSILSNPEKAKKMGERAREDVLKRFNLDVLVIQNIEEFRRICGK